MATTANGLDPASAPDMMVDVGNTFGLDVAMTVPAFSRPNEYVPDVDTAYVFDRETTLAILAGFAHNRRVMIQGYHGTGKSTHIEQVAARLNWPCVRVNLDSPYQPHRSRRQGRDRAEGRQAGDRIPRRHPALGDPASGLPLLRRI